MKRSPGRVLDTLATGLALLFALDRLARLAAVIHFFQRPAPPKPATWPTASILQPITKSANDLASSLRASAQLDYPGGVQHILICDATDNESQAAVRNMLAEFPGLDAKVVLVETPGKKVAPKLKKLQAGLECARGEVFCFIDDDIAPPADALQVLIPYLYRPGVGAAFGMPYYINWRGLWSSMLSGFANSNMILNFIPLTYLSRPFRVMGHFVAYRRDLFMQAGGLDGLEAYLDDDFAIGRRLREHGLELVQTPLVYGTDNEVQSRKAYEGIVKRWIVMPWQTMADAISLRQRTFIVISGSTFLLPGLSAVLALLSRRKAALLSMLACLGLFSATHAVCEVRYLRYRTPLKRWWMLLLSVLVSPLQIAGTLLSSNVIEWRGQHWKVNKDGKYEAAPHKDA